MSSRVLLVVDEGVRREVEEVGVGGVVTRRSNNAAVDRVGGLSGLRAHMEEQTIYRECTGESSPRHCHVVATWRYSVFSIQ